jgi:hypothetical protein
MGSILQMTIARTTPEYFSIDFLKIQFYVVLFGRGT